MNSRQETLSAPPFARIVNPNADEIRRLAQGLNGQPNKLLTFVRQSNGDLLVDVVGQKEAPKLVQEAKGVDPATKIVGEVLIHQSPKEEEF